MATKHPGKVSHRLQTGMGRPPEPLVKVTLGTFRTNVSPELAEGLFEQVGTVDLQVFSCSSSDSRSCCLSVRFHGFFNQM
jgi:hypothetical protein